MVFNSIPFLLFFAVVVGLYFTVPHRHRWWLLLLASSVFYISFTPKYFLILVIVVLIGYLTALGIERVPAPLRKSVFMVGIFLACLPLVVFKYLSFINANDWGYPVKVLALILPIGLSFYTLQSLAYVIEVYRGNQKAERHPGIYGLYMMFFPQVLAGPIARPQRLLPQFRKPKAFEYQRVIAGLKLMVWGMFKKVVIADQLAFRVNPVFDNPRAYHGTPFILATVFFAFQIYCDFSGYSDIAIGAAKVLGFDLGPNFDRPYAAKSISDFWRRWHISLSSWLRDYLFLPISFALLRRLPGERYFKIRTETWGYALGLGITMVLGGLWHGAGWNFVIWGGLFWFYLAFSLATRSLRKNLVRRIGLNKLPRLHHYIQVGITFALVCFAWVFFRAREFSDAWYIITHLYVGLGYFKFPSGLLWLAVLALIVFAHRLERPNVFLPGLVGKPLALRWAVFYLFILGIYYFGFKPTQFIYFQF